MGVVKRQSIKESLVNYAGAIIGAFAALFLYARDDADTAYGIARFVIDTSIMLSPFMMVGFGNLVVRFFPEFKEKDDNYGGFLPFVVGGVLLGCLLLSAGFWVFKEQIYSIYQDKSNLHIVSLPFILFISITLALFNVFHAWSSNFGRTAVPALLQNINKIVLPFIILMIVMELLRPIDLIYGLSISYVVSLLGIVLYIRHLGQLRWKPDWRILQDKKMIRRMRTYAFYGLFGSIGSALATRIDSVMISTLLDFKQNGAYGVAALIGGTIAIPTRALTRIAGPMVTQAFKDGENQKIEALYKMSSINPLIVGLFFFVGVMVSANDLFALMNKNSSLQQGAIIVLFIGGAQIVDMATGINNQIINYSKHYRFGFYTILLLAVFNITANWFLIPIFKISGAAIATFSSMLLYNIIKLVFIYFKMGMQPFSIKTVLLLVVAISVAGITLLIPSSNHLFLDILIRSVAVTLLYLPTIYYLRISDDINLSVDNFLKKWR